MRAIRQRSGSARAAFRRGIPLAALDLDTASQVRSPRLRRDDLSRPVRFAVVVRPARINNPKLRPAANSVDTSRSPRMVTALRKKRRWSFQRRFSPRERCPSSIRCLGRGTTLRMTTERSTVDYARSRGTILRPARRISDLSARPFTAMTIACLDGKQAPPRNAREIKGEPCSSRGVSPPPLQPSKIVQRGIRHDRGEPADIFSSLDSRLPFVFTFEPPSRTLSAAISLFFLEAPAVCASCRGGSCRVPVSLIDEPGRPRYFGSPVDPTCDVPRIALPARYRIPP